MNAGTGELSTPQLRRLIGGAALAATAMAMSWPALLAATWSQTHSETWLGVVGAARMAPYVLLSWAAGALGDRISRTVVVRVSALLRAALLVAVAVAFSHGMLITAIVLATLVVAVGTPAYPALAAAMPATAGARSASATNWLVTFEVSAFVVGPAIGGLLLGFISPTASVVGAAVTGVVAVVLLSGLRLASAQDEATEQGSGLLTVLLGIPAVLRMIGTVALVNLVEAAVGLALLPLAQLSWNSGQRGFGLATAALGFGALGAPVLQRVLRLGPMAVTAALLVSALPLVLVASTPSALWAVIPLAVLGAASTQVECAATNVLQDAVPDHARAFVLGVADTVMVAAALLGALCAPWLAGQLGPRVLLLLLAAATIAGGYRLVRGGVRRRVARV